ncbi:MAG: hypothetical protein Q9227_008926 [Pyrenula ochraceoflavens]
MAEEIQMPKPKCGGGAAGAQEYDVGIHTLGLFLVLAASCFGAGFPVVAKKVKWMKIPPNIFFFCKHFGTGVLIATAFVHLLPTAFQSLNDPCLPALFTDLYAPLPGVIMMGSLFVLFVIEMWLHSKTGGHSHGGATGAGIVPHGVPQQMAAPVYRARDWDEKTLDVKESIDSFSPYNGDAKSEMPAWFIVFYEQYVRQRDTMLSMIRQTTPNRFSMAPPAVEASRFSGYEGDVEVAEPAVDPLVLKKMSLQITLIEGGILFHSVFVGMTVSITIDGFIVLLVAILFHQMFEGLGLGSRIAAVPYPKGSIRPWLLVFAFGTTAPIGQAIGLLTRSSYDPESAFGLIIVGTFNAISSGLLLYAALVDLLAQDFLSEEADATMNKGAKIKAFIYVLLGAAGMSIVGAFA